MIRILRVEAPEYGTVIAELSDGQRYYAFLAEDFALDPRLPQAQKLWSQVAIDASGLCLSWPNGFRVRIEHVVEFSYRVDSRGVRPRRRAAAALGA